MAAIENKEKKTPAAERAKSTTKGFGEWFEKLFLPTLAVGSLFTGGFAMAALLGGTRYIHAKAETTKEPHPWLDKIGDAIKGMTSKP
jgi:hypothetical protein